MISGFMPYVRILWKDTDLLHFTTEEITQEYDTVLHESIEFKGTFEGSDMEYLLSKANQCSGAYQRSAGLWYEYYNNFVKYRLLNKKRNTSPIRQISTYNDPIIPNCPPPATLYCNFGYLPIKRGLI
jgi:hypothetical protein